jgi:hypothetical protein
VIQETFAKLSYFNRRDQRTVRYQDSCFLAEHLGMRKLFWQFAFMKTLCILKICYSFICWTMEKAEMGVFFLYSNYSCLWWFLWFPYEQSALLIISQPQKVCINGSCAQVREREEILLSTERRFITFLLSREALHL